MTRFFSAESIDRKTIESEESRSRSETAYRLAQIYGELKNYPAQLITLDKILKDNPSSADSADVFHAKAVAHTHLYRSGVDSDVHHQESIKAFEKAKAILERAPSRKHELTRLLETYGAFAKPAARIDGQIVVAHDTAAPSLRSS